MLKYGVIKLYYGILFLQYIPTLVILIGFESTQKLRIYYIPIEINSNRNLSLLLAKLTSVLKKIIL